MSLWDAIRAGIPFRRRAWARYLGWVRVDAQGNLEWTRQEGDVVLSADDLMAADWEQIS